MNIDNSPIIDRIRGEGAQPSQLDSLVEREKRLPPPKVTLTQCVITATGKATIRRIAGGQGEEKKVRGQDNGTNAEDAPRSKLQMLLKRPRKTITMHS